MVYLNEEEIDAIIGIFSDGLIDYDKVTRNSFLNGIDQQFVATFLKKVGEDPIDQLENDLRILNKKLKTWDNKIPLQIWLKNVERKLKPIKHKVDFTELIRKVSAEDSKNPMDSENLPAPEYLDNEITTVPKIVILKKKIREFFNKYVNKKAVRSLVIGMSAVILLIFLKVFFDQITFGYEKNIEVYEFLHSIPSNSYNKELPVVVLDISDLKPALNGAAPPDKLQEIVEGLFESGAKAVAVNIKFTPRIDRIHTEESGLRHENDFDFFDYLLEQKNKGNPVFLGVHQFDAEPESWLGSDEYKELAADMTICEEEKCRERETSEIPSWLQCGDYPKLYSIGRSLANFSENNPQPPSWLKPLLREYEDEKNLVNISLPDRDGNKIPCRRALMPVNYTKLEQMENSYISAITKEAVLQANNKFKNKMVIIGKARRGKTTATADIIGRNDVVPGVFIPAMAAYTLISDPIYKLKPWVSILLDFLIGTLLVFGLFIIRLWKGKNDKSAQKSELVFLSAFILIILFSGVLIARFYNVLWLDFALVIFAPFLYSKFENKIFNRLFSDNKSDT